MLTRKCTRVFAYSPESGGGSEEVEIFQDEYGNEYYEKAIPDGFFKTKMEMVKNEGKNLLRSGGSDDKHCGVTDYP